MADPFRVVGLPTAAVEPCQAEEQREAESGLHWEEMDWMEAQPPSGEATIPGLRPVQPRRPAQAEQELAFTTLMSEKGIRFSL